MRRRGLPSAASQAAPQVHLHIGRMTLDPAVAETLDLRGLQDALQAAVQAQLTLPAQAPLPATARQPSAADGLAAALLGSARPLLRQGGIT